MSIKIVTWNVNGIRAAIGKEFIQEYEKSNADIYCIQETKAQDHQVRESLVDIPGVHIYSCSAEKKGYSGVATLAMVEPSRVSEGINHFDHDQEGRVLTTEFDSFTLVNVYVPNSGNGLKRLDYRAEWDKTFAKYLSGLRKQKPVIVTGDFNVAHQPIDLARPKANYNKTSGYTQVEIDGMSGILSVGLVDAFRFLYPEKIQYTFWSMRFGARAKNVGWRIDYFLVDEILKDKIKDVVIRDSIMGSDHCPLELIIDI